MSTATAITVDEMLGDVAKLDQFLADKKALRSKDAQDKRQAASALAYRIIFGIFERKGAHYGGEWVGTAAKLALRAKNGDKPVKARTVTEALLGSVTVTEMFVHLDLHKTTRLAAADAIAKLMRVEQTPVSEAGRPVRMQRKHSDVEVDTWLKAKQNEINAAYGHAQQYINVFWGKIPAAMQLIRFAGNGKVQTTDGEEKPVALAFEMVLLNRAETPKQFAKLVVGK